MSYNYQQPISSYSYSAYNMKPQKTRKQKTLKAAGIGLASGAVAFGLADLGVQKYVLSNPVKVCTKQYTKVVNAVANNKKNTPTLIDRYGKLLSFIEKNKISWKHAGLVALAGAGAVGLISALVTHVVNKPSK